MDGQADSGVWRRLLRLAQAGDRASAGNLLEVYGHELHLVAEMEMDRKLRARLSAADVVQETLLEAHRDLEQFRGASEREFLAWLRQILTNNLRRAVEQHVLAEKRDVRRDISLDGLQRPALLGAADSSIHLDLPGRDETPSACVERCERAILLSDLLESLSPAHRDVLVLRNLQSLPFREVAQQMDRSVPATKMLWMRAMEQLRQMAVQRHRDALDSRSARTRRGRWW